MKRRTILLYLLFLACSCSTKNKNQADNFSFELIESTDFSKIYDEIKENEKLIIDSVINLYKDSLKSKGDTSFIAAKVDFRKTEYNNKGYLFFKVGYCPNYEFNHDQPLSILGAVDMKDSLDVSNRLNNPRIREILNDTLKWNFDLIRINDKIVCTLLLLKNNPKNIMLDINYLECLNLNEDKGMLVEFGGKAYFIKLEMNEKFKNEIRSFQDNQYFIVKIKLLNDYFYFLRSIKQLKENSEFIISWNASKSHIQEIKNGFTNYKNIICP